MSGRFQDVDAALEAAVGIAEQVERLVHQATDPRTPADDRRTAAMTACQLIASSGVLTKIRAARAWYEANKVHLQRASAGAAFLNSFRGGRR